MNTIVYDNKNTQLTITGKTIKNLDFMDYCEITFNIDKSNNLFGKNNISKEDVTIDKDIHEIKIDFYNGEELYLKNLKLLPNLTAVSIINLKNVYLPDELLQLTNLKKIHISTEVNKKILICNLDLLGYLVNLEHLILNIGFNEFPKSILQLSKLKYLYIQKSESSFIPNEMCNLKNLQKIDIEKPHSNLIHEHKMMIFDWDEKTKSIMELASGYSNKIVNIQIPPQITDLKILNCCYNKLDNLPHNISILRIGDDINYPLSNLPTNLKKLIIYKKDNLILVHQIKLPFGCELIIKEFYEKL